MTFRRLARQLLTAGTLAWCAPLGLSLPSTPASAQAIAVTVNGDPITTIDIEEHMKYLRVLRKPATREATIEDLVADRLKLRQANKYGIDATDSDLTQTLNRIAVSANMKPDVLAQTFQRAKASSDAIRSHLHAVAAWNNYVRARNKSLNVSEEEITAALAKQSNRAKEDASYVLQQVVFVVPLNAGAGVVEQRIRDAQALRGRFQDCSSGLALARSLPDVAVKPPMTRDAKSLSEKARGLLDQTVKGHLTAPERSATGVEMIAVCGKEDEADRTTVRDNIQADLITERLSKVADQMYQELRATAVIEKR